VRPPEEKVVIAYLHPGLVHAAFMESVVDLLVYDTAFHKRIVQGGGRLATQSGANLSGPRNGLIRRFLDYDAADWLFMVDTDMTFRPDTVERLLEFADPDTAPVVGGLCFGFDDKGDIQPTLFGLTGDEQHPQVIRYHEWPPEAMFQVAATGAACLLLHKSALIRMRDAELPQRPGKRGFNDAFPWFQELEHDGLPVSEDIGFCWRAGLLGIPVWVNTAVQLGHIKDRELTMDAYFAQRGGFSGEGDGEGDGHGVRGRERGADLGGGGAGAGSGRAGGAGPAGSVHYPAGAARRVSAQGQGGRGFLIAPPATAEVAVVVPVMKRPQNAEAFMRSLRASTGLATVYAICDADDEATIMAWRAEGAHTLLWLPRGGRPGTFAEKVNAGYVETAEPWLFLVGDDVRFYPGWLDSAQAAAGDQYHVVGTNDLGNPRVLSGEHATHLLVRRKYVAGMGASFDGPGVVAHEGYRHWFVDDEIVAAAKARGVWTPCLESVVEHLHPYYDKAPDDEVYQAGGRHADEDLALFEARVREYL
jgi:hypothetical protein